MRVEAAGELAVVRIERPPANALDLELLETVLQTLAQLRVDEPRAVVLTGSGRFFSAGLDVKVLPALEDDGKRSMVEGVNKMFAGWYGLPFPLVCAVTGHAVAGGMVLALCGDVRVASSEAAYGLTEARVGVPYPACAAEILRSELTAVAARRLVLGADMFEPGVALELGLFDELRPPELVEQRAVELATELAEMPGSAYGISKRALREGALERMERALVEVDPVIRFWQERLGPR
jgi:enoyl-CoA hydratase